MCLPWYELRKSTKNEVNIYGRRHCKGDELYDCVFGQAHKLECWILFPTALVVYEEKKIE